MANSKKSYVKHHHLVLRAIRYLKREGFAVCIPEMVLGDKRIDVIGYNAHNEICGVSVKTSKQELSQDYTLDSYRRFVDKIYFFVEKNSGIGKMILKFSEKSKKNKSKFQAGVIEVCGNHIKKIKTCDLVCEPHNRESIIFEIGLALSNRNLEYETRDLKREIDYNNENN